MQVRLPQPGVSHHINVKEEKIVLIKIFSLFTSGNKYPEKQCSNLTLIWPMSLDNKDGWGGSEQWSW